MAHEVFDDIAFYWFLMATLVALAFPMTSSFLSVLPIRGKPKDWTRAMSSCKAKHARTDGVERKETMNKVFGWRGVGFVVIWVGLISLIMKMSFMQGEELYSFNPYRILGIEEGLEGNAIKKAYRKLSLQFHPDKNPGNSEAAAMFIKIAKAYEVLTDDATRENYEKYGNPDGFQGASMTIGLPSWLTDKDNELAVRTASTARARARARTAARACAGSSARARCTLPRCALRARARTPPRWWEWPHTRGDAPDRAQSAGWQLPSTTRARPPTSHSPRPCPPHPPRRARRSWSATFS